MKPSSRLAPSVTAALILFTVALTGLLAYRAFDSSRAQQQTVARTLQDYAGFAAFQVKNSTVNRVTAQSRGAFDLVVRSINSNGPMSALDADSAATLIKARADLCRCLGGARFFYRVTFADSSLDATASDSATAKSLESIRDTMLAQAFAISRNDPQLPLAATERPPGVPLTSQFLVTILASLGERAYVLTHALSSDTLGKPIVAYGFAVPADEMFGRTVKQVLASQPVLPTTLTRGLRMDSVLAVTIRDPSGRPLYDSDSTVARRYAAVDSLDSRLGAIQFEVAIAPDAAGQLIIGGLPTSRLPEVLATALVSVALLGLLLYQFRRQEELGRMRDEFVAGVSHELRTPLAQIRLLAELLRLGKVPTEERQERSLRIIDQEARRLSFLVDSILSFDRTGRAQLTRVRCDIAAEIEDIVCGFEPLAAARGVRVATDCEPGIVAEVDRGAFRQVVLNLLDNAVRYGPEGQQVRVSTASEGQRWYLRVEDEGPGIPADERERIFAPYYRMKRDSGGAVGGTGIGLAVVRQLAEAHGARVYVAPSSEFSGSVVIARGAAFVVEWQRTDVKVI
ncbi:MAG: sensor histidine kinase [Gemmatimonas sp.]